MQKEAIVMNGTREHKDKEHEHLKRRRKTVARDIIAEAEAIQDDTMFHWFANNTTAHGFGRMAMAQTVTKKIAWALAITIALLIVCVIIGKRINTYYHYETITETKFQFSSSLEFPAVTVCNVNMISKRSLKFEADTLSNTRKAFVNDPFSDSKTNLGGSGERVNSSVADSYNTDTGEIVPALLEDSETILNDTVTEAQDDFKYDWSSTTTTSSTTQIYMEADDDDGDGDGGDLENEPVQDMSVFDRITDSGWQLVGRGDTNDSTLMTLLECKYNRKLCSSKWFKQSVTEYGNCYTFNHRDIPADLTAPHPNLQQNSAGSPYGLKLKLNVETAQYTTDMPFRGVKVFVHHHDAAPDLSQEGVYVGAGVHSDITFKLTEINNHAAPWGECSPMRKLELSDRPYTIEACAAECKVKAVINECKCRPFYYESDEIQPCNNIQWYDCAKFILDSIDLDFYEWCDCPASCYSAEYDLQASYIQSYVDIPLKKKALNMRYYGDSAGNYQYFNIYDESVVSLNLYYRSMTKTVITEKKAIDEIGLLSEVGGQLGLFVGISVLTLCEVLETIIMCCVRAKHKREVERDLPVYVS